MEEYPVDKLSIQMREKIMIPLATIQQYGLSKLREMDNSGEEELSNSYQKMIIRCAFGIINGGRNSA
jgi:phosphoenolpyruvate carboxylase